MKLGIFAKTFPGTTPLAVLSAARDSGYAAVQYNMACSGLAALPLEIAAGVAEAVAEASHETGVEIAAVSATYNMIHPSVAVRENGRRSFEAIASVARRMGTRLLTVCSGTRDPDDQWRHHSGNADPAAWQDMCLEFSRLLAIAETYDVEIGVEPELNNVVSSAERARQLIDTLASHRIRIVFDAANLVEIASREERRRVIESAVDLLQAQRPLPAAPNERETSRTWPPEASPSCASSSKSWIVLAHAKDRRSDGQFAPAGQGVIDFAHYVTALGRARFNGPLITHGLAACEASQVATFLKSQLAAAESPWAQ